MCIRDRVKAAILGYGTVGSGVAEVLSYNQELIAKRAGNPIEVKYILDLRDFPGDPNETKVVHDIEVILQDPEISIVGKHFSHAASHCKMCIRDSQCAVYGSAYEH